MIAVEQEVLVMVSRVSKSRFKAQALEIFRRIESTGEPVIVTDRGEPTLVVRKYVAQGQDARARLRGSVMRYDDPFEPVGTDDWEAVR
jgi:antitoxin (DNA-binding transcriptional repressor) of toxin-antitoxin stability system